MVVFAQEEGVLRRANYAELEQAAQPQSIASLLPQVLARYSLVNAEVRLPEPTKPQRAQRTTAAPAKQLFS